MREPESTPSPEKKDPLAGLAVRRIEVPPLIGTGLSTVDALIASGRLESVKIGRSRLVTTRSIRALLYRDAA